MELTLDQAILIRDALIASKKRDNGIDNLIAELATHIESVAKDSESVEFTILIYDEGSDEAFGGGQDH